MNQTLRHTLRDRFLAASGPDGLPPAPEDFADLTDDPSVARRIASAAASARSVTEADDAAIVWSSILSNPEPEGEG